MTKLYKKHNIITKMINFIKALLIIIKIFYIIINNVNKSRLFIKLIFFYNINIFFIIS
jgi:hypothetical protein